MKLSKTVGSFMTIVLTQFVCASAQAAQKRGCSVTYKSKSGKSEEKLPITKETTTKTYGSFQVKIESNPNGSTEVLIEANGMKAMQSGSGTTKASLSDGDERIEAVCR